jgi:ribonuclease HI
MAKRLLTQLQAKWHPDNHPPVDDLTHTPNRKLANMAAHANNGSILFNPSVTSQDDLSHNFRVFTSPEAKCVDPGYRKHRLTEEHMEEVTVFTDGACEENGFENAQAGSGVWFGPNDPRNKAFKVPGLIQSKQVGQLVAVLQAVKSTPPFAPLHIMSNSRYIINCFTKNLPHWEAQGWIGIHNKEFITPIVSHMRARGAITTFTRTKGQEGIEKANKLANEGLQKVSYNNLDLTLNKKFNLTGAQLSTMSQAMTYQGIRERMQITSRRSTIITLDITRHAVKRITGHLPTDATIWHSIRSKDITRTIRVFLWKLIHGTHKCGDFWLKIPDFEHRSLCPECRVEDSMTHILTECRIPGQKEIWRLTEELWLAKHNSWPKVNNLGVIVGCAMASFLTKTGQRRPGAERLYRILMTESAHLIWRIRCERILERSNKEEWHTTGEIQNRWLYAINKRLSLDQAMTNKKYETKAISAKTVLNTWSGTLPNELSLPDNWINLPGVLVGIGPSEQPWWRQTKPP